MTDLKSDEAVIGDPAEKGKKPLKKGAAKTPRNREESMEEAGQDGFQHPDTSGTTGLGGESADSDSVREPGGVEGAGATD